MVRLASLVVALAAPLSLAATAVYGVEPFNQPVHIFSGWSYTDCSSNSDKVEIRRISVSPDPPEPGKNLTVTAAGTVKPGTVIEEGAYANVLVKIGLVKLLSKQFDLCEEARNANLEVQCPVQPGEYTISQTVELPREIPRAKFTVDVQGFTVDDDDLFCLRILVDFLRRPF